MRPQSKPDALEIKVEPVSRDPSYPDRARIDSDVRAFLRPASSPWIVFDRDSRVDDFAKSALRVGAVFASSPTFRPSVIPASETGASSETGEPSSVVVSADVYPDSASCIPTSVDTEPPARQTGAFAAAPAPFGRRKVAAIVGACAGVLALVATSVLVIGAGARSSADHAKANAVEVKAPAAAPAPAPLAEEPAASADVPSPSPSASTTAEAPASEPRKTAKVPTDPKKRFGRLTIKGEAKRKNVYFDGKRMLGAGQRSFTVFCGMHTIAVNDKSDAKDIEIPCNGEYVVSK